MVARRLERASTIERAFWRVCDVPRKELADLRLRHESDKVLDDRAIHEQYDSRETSNPELLRQCLFLIGVDFRELEAARVLAREAIEHRHELPTRRAPGRPEIDEHRLLSGCLDDVRHETTCRHGDSVIGCAHKNPHKEYRGKLKATNGPKPSVVSVWGHSLEGDRYTGLCFRAAISSVIIAFFFWSLTEGVKMQRSVVYLLGLIAGVFPVLASAQWAVKAEAGVVAARGNSDTDTANAKLKIVRDFERWKHTLEAAGVYASDSTGTIGQRWNVREQTDYQISDKGFWFVSGRYEDDRFSGFEYQSTLGTGFGWRFFDDEVTKLSVQVGGGYKMLRRQDSLAEDGITLIPGERERSAMAQGSVDFERQLTATTKVLNKLLVETSSDNTFVQNDLSLEVKILGSLALAVGYSVRYNTDPPAEFTTTDTLTTLNLVYEIE